MAIVKRKTLYDVLGILPDAREELIRDAYMRQLKRLDAPGSDVSPEDLNIQRIAIEEAFATLSDEARRKRYDASIQPEFVRITEPRIDRGEFKWALILLCSLVVGGGFFYFSNLQAKRDAEIRARAEIERLHLAAQAEENARAAAAEEAARVARDQEWQRRREEQRVDSMRQDLDYANERRYEKEKEQQERAQRERERREAEAERSRQEEQARVRERLGLSRY